MGILGDIPTAAQLGQEAQKAEDHLGVVVKALIGELRANADAILAGRKVVVTISIEFPEKA